jgi:peroxiredoxin
MLLVAAVVALALVTLVCGIAIYYVIVQQGRILLRLESLETSQRQGGASRPRSENVDGVPAGSVLNDFELRSLAGGRMTLSQFRGRKVLLIFFDPACGYCRELLLQLRDFAASSDADAPVPLIIAEGPDEENRKLVEEHGIRHPVLMQDSREVAELYHVFVTPAGYLVDERGVTVGGMLAGKDQILAAGRGTRVAAPGVSPSGPRGVLLRDGLKAGTAAPPFKLPRVDGSQLALADLRGQEVLLVFSDPACGPCNVVAPKLEQLHRKNHGLRVIMISRGGVEANRAKIAEFGLTFPVVLQRHWEVSRDYGMFATPIAYVIDREGVLQSDVLVGVEPILKAASGSLGTSRFKEGR